MRHETLFLFINNVGLVAIFKVDFFLNPRSRANVSEIKMDGSELNVDQISAVIFNKFNIDLQNKALQKNLENLPLLLVQCFGGTHFIVIQKNNQDST